MPTTPAGPTAPAALQRIRWILNPVRFLRNGHGSTYLVSDPKALQAILSSNTGRLFRAPGDRNRILAPLPGRRGTILLSGEEHRQRRFGAGLHPPAAPAAGSLPRARHLPPGAVPGALVLPLRIHALAQYELKIVLGSSQPSRAPLAR